MQRTTIEPRLGTNLLFLALLSAVWLVAILIGNMAAIILAVLASLVGILVRPAIGMSFSIVLWGSQLVQLLSGLPGIVFRSAPFIVLIFTFLGILVSRKRPFGAQPAQLSWLIPLTFIPSAFASIFAEDVIGFALATSTYLVPILVFVIGLRLSSAEHRLVAITAAAVLGANFIAALWQFVSGVDQFLALGLQYGTSVRTIDGVVRAPGLMIINSELGLFAGTLGLLALIDVILGTKRNGPTLNTLILFFSVGSLLLSTSRSGALILVSGALGAYLISSKKRQSKRKQLVAGFFFVGILLAGFVTIGATSNTSWSERLTQWANLLRSSTQLFGSGPGSVGAASFSDYSNRIPSFTDNMYISILIQFGVFGVLALLFALYNIYSKKDHFGAKPSVIHSAEARIVIGAIAITSVLVEVLDYQLAMLFVALIVSRANLDLNKSNISEMQKV